MSQQLLITVAAALAAITSAPALAQSVPVAQELVQSQAGQSGSYWTPERMRNARPMSPSSSVAPNNSGANTNSSSETPGPLVPGAGPTVPFSEVPSAGRVAPALAIDELAKQQAEAAPDGTVSPQANKYGLPFTTQRMSPADAPATYPASAAGKLFFTQQGVGDFICSGAVIRLRVVQTAGHCVYQPATSTQTAHFYTNFLFEPAYANGTAPYGKWTPFYMVTSGEWAAGGDTVPNAQDIGELVMYDMQLTNGTVAKIGQVTGYFGYITGGIANQHITQLGYPKNLDGGELMERTDAGQLTSNGTNTYIMGTAQGGGASGGPWIVDFGVNPANTDPIASNPAWNLGLNYLVAATSYGPLNTQGYTGASVFNSSFTAALNLACSQAAGSC